MENCLKIKENLWKCLPERKCSKFIKNEIFDNYQVLSKKGKKKRTSNYSKTKVKLKLFEKPKFWNFFENWSFENYLKIEVLKIGVLKIIWKWSFAKLEFWKLKFWKLNLKIRVLKIKFGKTGVLKIIWKLEFWKLNFDM